MAGGGCCARDEVVGLGGCGAIATLWDIELMASFGSTMHVLRFYALSLKLVSIRHLLQTLISPRQRQIIIIAFNTSSRMPTI